MLRPSLAAILVLAAPVTARPAGAQPAARPGVATCIAEARKLTHSSSITRNDDHEFRWRASGCEVRLSFDHGLRFTDDFRSIAALEGSVFRATEDGTVDRALEIRAGDGGALRFAYRVGGRERPFETDGQAWLESVLVQLFRRGGYAADERVQWLLGRGGADAVVAELALMESDHVRHAYSLALLRRAPDDAAVQARLLASAAAWSSDHYKAELLEALTGRSPDPRVTRAAWGVARSLDSDYYASKGIARLLTLGAPDAAEMELALAALDGVESDYYRARVLAALVDRGPLPAAQLLDAIRATSQVKSAHYRSQSLVRIARAHELTGDALAAYMAAAEAIEASHYRTAAVRAVRREARDEDDAR